jgi:outer membrane protein insertion porin family
MANFSMDGRETIQLRGYPNNSLTPINAVGEQIGATVHINSRLNYVILLL